MTRDEAPITRFLGDKAPKKDNKEKVKEQNWITKKGSLEAEIIVNHILAWSKSIQVRRILENPTHGIVLYQPNDVVDIAAHPGEERGIENSNLSRFLRSSINLQGTGLGLNIQQVM